MNEREIKQNDNLTKQALSDLRARVEVLEKIVLAGPEPAKPSKPPAMSSSPTTKKDH